MILYTEKKQEQTVDMLNTILSQIISIMKDMDKYEPISGCKYNSP